MRRFLGFDFSLYKVYGTYLIFHKSTGLARRALWALGKGGISRGVHFSYGSAVAATAVMVMSPAQGAPRAQEQDHERSRTRTLPGLESRAHEASFLLEQKKCCKKDGKPPCTWQVPPTERARRVGLSNEKNLFKGLRALGVATQRRHSARPREESPC